MKSLRKSGMVFGLLCACAAPWAHAQFIFDNTTTTTFNAYGTANPDVFTFGDYVTFSGGPSTIGEVSFLMSVAQDNGLPEANFGLYVYDDNGGSVGTLLGSAVLNAYPFPGDGNYTLTFSGLSIPVGTSAFIGLSIDNYNSDNTFNDFIGVEMYDPPTVGSSDADSMLVAFGSGFTFGTFPSPQLGPGLNNIAMTITPVPEPAAAGCVGGLGLAAFCFCRRRRAA